MDIYNSNLAITNGLPIGYGTGISLDKDEINQRVKLTEYEKERLLAQENYVMDEEEKVRFMQRLEDGIY